MSLQLIFQSGVSSAVILRNIKNCVYPYCGKRKTTKFINLYVCLTPWSRVVEKLIVVLLVNKFPIFFMDPGKVKGKLPPFHSVKAYTRYGA